MTLKYESEILFDLMKRDGDDTPSDVLPYESELKEKYLKQVEGAYPKLMDYRPEWLNYNLEAHLPADFPVETLTNVTSATVDNVVPYAYRSAVLKGQTLVNIVNGISLGAGATEIDNSYVLTQTGTNEELRVTLESNLIELNKDYTFIYYIQEKTTIVENSLAMKSLSYLVPGSNIVITQNVGWNKVKFNVSSFGTNPRLNIAISSSEEDGVYVKFAKDKFALLNGDWTQKEIPFDTLNCGMQSVKMPVLTTVGKNLILNKNDVKVNPIPPTLDYKDGGFSFDISETKWQNVWYDLNLKPNTNYTISYNSNFMDCFVFKSKVDTYVTSELVSRVEIKNKNEDTLQSPKLTFTSPSSGFVRIRLTNNNMSGHHVVKNIQLEEGSIATSYEPFKSNILTVNEPVELRGIGDVQDTLDCLTGQMTERIGEAVIDGSQTLHTQTCADENYYRVYVVVPNMKLQCDTVNNLLPSQKAVSGDTTGEYVGSHISSSSIHIRILSSRLSERSNEAMKQFLQSNPIRLQYQFATESIKTVDLNIQDQDGNTLRKIKPIEGTMHIHSDGTPVKPTITMEIPVEAITQNLASFIKEE